MNILNNLNKMNIPNSLDKMNIVKQSFSYHYGIF